LGHKHGSEREVKRRAVEIKVRANRRGQGIARRAVSMSYLQEKTGTRFIRVPVSQNYLAIT
jgi:hypothetical protein